jgi:hemerythrin superfamily protein
MPDVIQVLTQDHRTVEQLFDQYEESMDASVLAQICDELQIHTQVEEEIVYPTLARIDRPLEEHAEEEHDQARHLIEEIMSSGYDSPQAQRMAMQLKQAVMEHVEEEESKAFPELRERMDDQLRTLGDRVVARKEEMQRER